MDRLDKSVIYATISYATVNLVLFFTIATFVEDSYKAVVLLLLFSLAFGYIISSHLITSKREQDKILLHLTKEILHEINIPISTIELNSNMLKRNIEDKKLLRRVERIEASNSRLERLYKELSYAIKKEIEQVVKEEFNLKNLIDSRVEEFIEYRRQKFTIDIDKDVAIYADKIGFEKVVDNLISNAMKYSYKNSTIKIYYKDLVLNIEDSGIGMDEVELLRVFERYYQVNEYRDGKGIGLAIVKEYCERNNIEIDLLSTKHIGTRVKLNLNRVKI
jgi:signal transduction histidine kinase